MEKYDVKFELLLLQKLTELLNELTFADEKLTVEMVESIKKNHEVVGLTIIRMLGSIEELLGGV